MSAKKVTSIYFSPTGNVKKLAKTIGKKLSEVLGAEYAELDVTPSSARQIGYDFTEDDIVVIGFPVFAGRIPNKMLPFLQENIKGHGSIAVPFVSYGNRSFDDGLSELLFECKNNGFVPVGGAAFACEHSFANSLATGRPDAKDLKAAADFACKAGQLIKENRIPYDLQVDGNTPPGPYYTPKKEDGEPAVFLKAKPVTDKEKCINCKACARHCPMGSISMEDTADVPGICIKCQACVHICPKNAKSFENEDFLSHKKMLEANFTEYKENKFYY